MADVYYWLLSKYPLLSSAIEAPFCSERGMGFLRNHLTRTACPTLFEGGVRLTAPVGEMGQKRHLALEKRFTGREPALVPLALLLWLEGDCNSWSWGSHLSQEAAGSSEQLGHAGGPSLPRPRAVHLVLDRRAGEK